MSLNDLLNEGLQNALESPEEAIQILQQIGSINILYLCIFIVKFKSTYSG